MGCGCKGNRAATDARNQLRAKQAEQRKRDVEAARRIIREGVPKRA